MKTIIVATDFSSTALNAAHYGIKMAKTVNAQILLLNVYEMQINFAEMGLPISVDDLKNIASNDMADLVDELNRSTDNLIIIKSEVIMGSFYPVLEEVCKRENPYTVIMGCQGKTSTEHLFFGSHAVYAMKYLPWPLITVPDGATFSDIKKVGIACDFDRVTETLPAEEIQTLVNDFHASLHIINTGKKSEFDADVVFQSGLMQEMLKKLEPQYHFIEDSNVDDGIMKFVEQNAIDLLIILPKRHTLLDKIFHKSHTKQMVLHAHVPVMALHQH